MTWIIVYSGLGPGHVGPFDSREQAATWADRYADEYADMAGTAALSWDVVEVVAADRLQWW